MKSKVTKRLLKIGSLLLALILCVMFLQEFVLCHGDHNRERIKGFYLEQKDSVDVLFVGASEVYSGFSSPYAYSKYGFTSYPLATQSNTMFNYLACVKEAVRTQHPKLLVIEINGALYDNDTFVNNDSSLRNVSDNLPLNASKVELVKKIATSDEAEYYFPIIKYHSVWENFPEGVNWNLSIIMSKLRGYNLLKGTKSKTTIFHYKNKIYNNELDNFNENIPMEKEYEQALVELLEYCKNNDLNVLFTRFPHIIAKNNLDRYQRSLYAKEIIKEYGFDYIEFDDKFDEIGIDYKHDFYNIEHLNLYGQIKLTDYLSRYLIENYNLEKSDLTDSEQKEWEESARYYDAFCKLYDDLIANGEIGKELGENFKTIQILKKYID